MWPEVSTFFFIEGDSYPQIRTREAETIIRVKDGQPVLIGGLLQEQEVESTNSVPILSNLPILGRLFTKTSRVYGKDRDEHLFSTPCCRWLGRPNP